MPPNVLLVVLDAARAKNFGSYGHENETTPFLSKFATAATTYTQARSPSTWSLPSHASMFTGLEVPEHEVTSRFDQLERGHTVWETLRDEYGYETGVFSENPFITSDTYGLQTGFDTVTTGLVNREYPFAEATNPGEYISQTGSEDDYLGYLKFAAESGAPVRSLFNAVVRKFEVSTQWSLPDGIATRPRNKSRAYADEFLDWSNRKSDWAACINFTDVHYPYQPQPEYDRWGGPELRPLHDNLEDHRWDFYSGREPWWKLKAIEQLYDASIRQIDATLEYLIEALERRDELDDTLVVITADHGEGFGEPSRIQPNFRIAAHAGGLHERLVHVPLFVRHPGQNTADTVERAASLTRFPDVVTGAADGDVRRSFAPDDEPVVSVSDVASQYDYEPKNFDEYRDSIDEASFSGVARAVYEDRGNGTVRKFAWWGEDEAVIDAYDAQNVARVSNVSGAREEVSTTFEQFSSTGVCLPNDRSDSVSRQTQRQLEDLGYV